MNKKCVGLLIATVYCIIIVEAECREKRTIDVVLRSFANVFGYDVKKRPSEGTTVRPKVVKTSPQPVSASLKRAPVGVVPRKSLAETTTKPQTSSTTEENLTLPLLTGKVQDALKLTLAWNRNSIPSSSKILPNTSVKNSTKHKNTTKLSQPLASLLQKAPTEGHKTDNNIEDFNKKFEESIQAFWKIYYDQDDLFKNILADKENLKDAPSERTKKRLKGEETTPEHISKPECTDDPCLYFLSNAENVVETTSLNDLDEYSTLLGDLQLSTALSKVESASFTQTAETIGHPTFFGFSSPQLHHLVDIESRSKPWSVPYDYETQGAENQYFIKSTDSA